MSLLFAGHSAKAVNGADTWVGNTSTDWAGMNWTGTNNPPISGDSLVFNADGTAGAAAGDVLTNSLTSSAFNIAGITFGAAAPAYTMTGNTFNLTAGITNNSTTKLQTFSNTGGLTSSGSYTYTLGGGITITNGLVNNSGGGVTTTVNGVGSTLTLGGYNVNTGGNRIVSVFNGTGNVNITGNITGGSSVDGLTYSGGGTLTIGGGFSFNSNGSSLNVSSGTISLTSAQAGAPNYVTGSGSFSETSAGSILNNGGVYGGFTQSSTGTTTLAGSNTYQNGTTVNSGTFNLSGTGTLSGGTAITVNGGAFNESGGAVISAGSTFTTTGGTTTLSGANTYTGATSVNGGTLTLDFSGATTPASATNIIKTGNTINLGGGALALKGGGSGATNSQTFGTTALTADTFSTINVNSNGGTALNLALGGITRNAQSTFDITLPTAGTVTTTLAQVPSNGILVYTTTGVAFGTANGGATWLAKTTGTGPFALTAYAGYATGNASYTSTNNVDVTNNDLVSGVTVNTLRFNAATDALTLAGINTVSTGGILVTPGTAASISGGTLQAGSAGKELVLMDYGTLNVGSVIADNTTASLLTLAGTGTTTLSGANTFTGQTALTKGTLNLSNGLALQYSPLQYDTGTALVFDQSAGTAFTIGGLSSSNNIALLNNATTPAAIALTLNVATGGSPTYSGVLSGAGATLTKTGPGTETLSGVNTYSGATQINGGTLQVSGSIANSVVTVGSGAFLSFNYGNGGRNESTVVSGVVSGAGGIIDNQGNPNATLTLDKANTYTGPTEITNRGVLKVQFATAYDTNGNPTSGSLGINSPFIVTSSGNPGTLFLNGINQQVGSLTSPVGTASNSITLGSTTTGATGAVLTTGGDNTSTNFGGTILEGAFPGAATNGGLPAILSTGGSVVKIGTGTQTFSGVNLYEGATTVKGGVLSVSTLANGGVMTTGSSSGASTTLTVASTAGIVAGERVQGNGVVYDNSGTVATVTAVNSGSVTLSGNVNVPASTPLYFGVGNGIGISTNVASNLVLDGGTLQYTGAAINTDRLFTVGAGEAGGATGTLDASGTGALNFTNTGAIAYGSGAGARTLGLTGTSTAANTLASLIGDNGAGMVSVTKSGAGSWTLTGANTYTGATTVNGGTLKLARAGTAGSATGGTLATSATGITVNTGGTLLVAASNAVGNTTPVNLGGGTFTAAGGASQGAGAHTDGGTTVGSMTTGGTVSVPGATSTLGLGALTLSGNSTLNFAGGGVSTLVFTSFDPGASNFKLNVTNYATTAVQGSGSSGTDGTDDRIVFDQALNSAQLADITFYGVANATEVQLDGGFYEVIGAVPEPGTYLGGLLLAAGAAWQLRRKAFRARG